MPGEDQRLGRARLVNDVHRAFLWQGDIGEVLPRQRLAGVAPVAEGGVQHRQDLVHGGVTHDEQRAVARPDPRAMEVLQVFPCQRRDRRLGAGPGERNAIGVVFTVDQRWQGAQGDAYRLVLFLLDLGQPPRAQTLDFFLREGRSAHDVGEQLQRRAQVLFQRRQRGIGHVQAGAGGNHRAETFGLGRDFQRIPGLGALVHHRQREACRAQVVKGVGGVTGVELHCHLDHRDGVAFGQHHLHAVIELGALDLGKFEVRHLADGRQALAAVHRGRDRAVLAERQHVEPVAALGQPLVCGFAHVGRRGLVQPAQRGLEEARVIRVQLALGQRDGLAAEAADLLEAAHDPGIDLGLRDVQLFGRRPGLEELRELALDDRVDLIQRRVFLEGDVDAEQARQFMLLHAHADVHRQRILVDQCLVEPRILAVAEHVGRQFEHEALARGAAGHRPVMVGAHLGHAVVHDLGGVVFLGRHPGLHALDRRAGLDVAKVLLRQRTTLLRRDVASQHQHGVGRAVVILEPLVHVFQRRGGQVFHRADGAVPVGVASGIHAFEHAVLDQPVGLVVALALLVLHHANLVVELLLGDGAEQVAHAIGLHPQRHFQRGGGHGLEVVGAVEPGGAVHAGGPDLLEGFEVLAVVVFRAVEHQVFEQVREAGLALGLVLGTDVVPDADRNDRRLVVLVHDHGQAIVEGEFLVRDVHVRHVRGVGGGAQQQSGQSSQPQGFHRFGSPAELIEREQMRIFSAPAGRAYRARLGLRECGMVPQNGPRFPAPLVMNQDVQLPPLKQQYGESGWVPRRQVLPPCFCLLVTHVSAYPLL